MHSFIVALLALSGFMQWIYQVDPALCNGCMSCVSPCPQGAISVQGGKAWIDPDLCNGCGICVLYCPRGAIYRTWYEGVEGDTEGVPGINRNPAAGQADVHGLPPNTAVVLCSITGRVVAEAISSIDGSASISLSGVPAGLYFACSETGAFAALTVVR